MSFLSNFHHFLNFQICLRDGKLRFIFRIHDFHRKIWCGTRISLYFIEKELICEDRDFELIEMSIEPYGLLIFPLEIEHVIDEKSPLWSFRPLDILQSRLVLQLSAYLQRKFVPILLIYSSKFYNYNVTIIIGYKHLKLILNSVYT